MEKRIRLNHKLKIPDKVALWLLLLTGSGYLFIGIDHLLQGRQPVSGTWNTSFGLVIIAYGLTYFGFFFPWTPQININDEDIKIKPGPFKKSALVRWADVSELKLGIRSVSFKIGGAYEDFKLSVSSSVSKDVKKSLREVATAKHIPVVGG